MANDQEDDRFERWHDLRLGLGCVVTSSARLGWALREAYSEVTVCGDG